MKRLLKIILIVFAVQGLGMVLFFSVLLGYSSYIKSQRIKKSEIEILENSENITQTVIFEERNNPVFRAKYKNIDRLFYSGWISDEDLWENAKILDDENVSEIAFLNKIVDSEVADEKYQLDSYAEHLVCFSKSGAYYGYKRSFGLYGSKLFRVFEIDGADLTDLYIDREENITRVSPDYEVLNYGTFKSGSCILDDYDFFYFVSSRAIYMYNGETAELHEVIETESDIYGVSYGYSNTNIRGYQLLVAVKDEKQFKVMEYIIE